MCKQMDLYRQETFDFETQDFCKQTVHVVMCMKEVLRLIQIKLENPSSHIDMQTSFIVVFFHFHTTEHSVGVVLSV